jgi:hypothetical protein
LYYSVIKSPNSVSDNIEANTGNVVIIFGFCIIVANVPALGEGGELRNFLFSVKDKNYCET